MRFASLPADQRPRERLAERGVESLSVQELLALQLRNGVRGSSASDLAVSLLAEFGGLHRLTTASMEELLRVPGIGEAKASSIVATFELGRRATLAPDERVTLSRASEVAALAMQQIGHCRRERVLVFVCDRRSRLLKTVCLSEGSDRRSLFDVREVLQTVLLHDGTTFAVAHNHPSGDPNPSAADIEATARIATAAKTVGIRFQGHIVVTSKAWAEVELRQAPRTLD